MTTQSQPAGGRRRRGGFTLIEVLAAMVIVAVLVLMLSRVFTESSRIWRLGMRQSEQMANARSVLDWLQRELQSAVANEHARFYLKPNDNPVTRSVSRMYGQSSRWTSLLYYVTLDREVSIDPAPHGRKQRHAAEHTLQAGEMLETFTTNEYGAGASDFIDQRYRIWHGHRFTIDNSRPNNGSLNIYEPGYDSNFNNDSYFGYFNPGTVMDNVARFQIFAALPDPNDPTQIVYDVTYDSRNENNQLPLWLDVYIELLGPVEADQARLMSGSDLESFLDKNVRRFTTRVYMRGRGGAAWLN